ncbi:MAG: homocysteine S-methyltransferase [Lewinellaceae bacterium]|nr:homocysteine S-methyltransferase [Lewinellaceae bacterium]
MNMETILQGQSLLFLDGAMATELEARGAKLQDSLWSAKLLMERPALIRQLHYDYFIAGADVAITASYQASFEGFEKHGLSRQRARSLMQLSVRLAQEARGQFWEAETEREGRVFPLVAASIGPYGAFLADGSEYRGQYGLSAGELADWHRPRLEALLEAGPDLLACETIPCPEEAEALLRLLEEFPEARAWLSFSCRDGRHLNQGERFTEGARIADACPQAIAIGINCTAPQYITALLGEARRVSSKPLLAYPNSGETWDARRHCWIEGSHANGFGKLPLEWYRAGARLIGGCCRTGPEDIKAMRALLLNEQFKL